MNDYNVLAKFLTDKYIDRVSGRDFPRMDIWLSLIVRGTAA